MSVSTTESRHSALDKLNELFSSVLTLDVIEMVAQSCSYDVQESSNKLLEMSSQRDVGPLSWSQMATQFKPGPIKQCASTGAISRPKSRKLQEIERTVDDIKSGYKVLVLLRGVSGSGKSYLAKTLLEQTIGLSAVTTVHVLSTDDYFVQRGLYKFDPSKLQEAHGWNHNRAFQAMSQGFSPVIIDNTNTQMWEMKPYAQMACDYGYIIKILEPDNHWSFNEKELAKRNVHGVPRHKIKDMLDRYDKTVTAPKLLSAYSLRYNRRPPQYRTYPIVQKPQQDNAHAIVKSQSASALNSRSLVRHLDQSSGEMINLMDFNEAVSNDACVNGAAALGNPLDDLLMCQDNGAVLKPNVQQATKEVVFDSSDEDIVVISSSDSKQLTNGASTANMDLESAWGVNESSLRSWDIVTLLPEAKTIEKPSQKHNFEKVETMDATCSTKDNLETDSVRVISAFSRDINEHTPLNQQNPIPKKIMVDQSCFTDDLNSEEEHLKYLKSTFPTVSSKHLAYLYKHCNGDLDWTVDWLLENKDDLEVLDNNLDSESLVETAQNQESVPNICEASSSSKTAPKRKFVQSKELQTQLFNDVDYKKEKMRKQSESDNDSLEDFDGKASSDDFVELNLGEHFVEQLENKFGDSTFRYPRGFPPIVQVPVDLARQLFSLYVESVYQQLETQKEVLDTMVKEDEELAKKLQSQEQAKWKDLEYKKELSGQWKVLNPETLADKLTVQKLHTTFPSIDISVLFDIYRAHNNNYQETVETLIANALPGSVCGSPSTINEPPINQDEYKELEEAHKTSQNCQVSEERTDARTYRLEANKHLQKREELHKKAQSYYQRGMIEVAQFYSDLASKQTKYFDLANLQAAQLFVNEHSDRLQDFNTLDLHYLYVKEAVPALDMFLDRNINLLQGGEKSSELLQIITGRGNRSQNGVSRIKPAVIARLKKRGLRYQELNPGLLRIKITRSCRTTSSVDS